MSKVKVNVARVKQEIALPFRIVWDWKWKGTWAVVFQCLIWGLVVSSMSPKPKPVKTRIENVPTKDVPTEDRPKKKRRRRKKSPDHRPVYKEV